jgi:beta-glucosidase
MDGHPSAADLTPAEQAALTAGIDFWHTAPIDRLGIGSLRLTDGPSGARGHRWSVGTSACLPCGSALAATWNRELVRRVGRVLADEARAKGAGVLLGPTVNIHRHPLNGRHFECLSEDPHLTAELAAAYIQGVQERGVGAAIKHFVCNDQEHERLTINVEVDERALREIYLPPFEAAVLKAGVWAVMGAYNRLRGTYCCENAPLLKALLKGEWGFDGVVMSDWFATHSTAAAASNGLDLEMPGPARFLGSRLAEAVARDEVNEAAVAGAAGRVLRLIERTADRADRPPGEAASAVARAAAAEAIVLLRNAGDVLPLDPARVRRLAVIGPLAARPAVQGGGSAEVTPAYVSSPLEAITARRRVAVTYEPGGALPGPTPPIDYRWLGVAPGSSEPGLQADVFASLDLSGPPVVSERLARSLARWGGSPAPGVAAGHFSARLTGEFVADRSGTWEFGLSSAGRARLFLDGRLLVEHLEPDRFYRQGANEARARVELERGSRHRLVAELRIDTGADLAGLRVGARPVIPADARQRAARAAAEADVAVLVVGYDGGWETEGADRPHMDLPGDQDELIRAVAAANPRTVVVLNAGAPVTMPWAEDVAAILQLWFPGMEGGNALGDVLFGEVDPAGRLPTTFPRRLEDSPAYPPLPGPGWRRSLRRGRLRRLSPLRRARPRATLLLRPRAFVHALRVRRPAARVGRRRGAGAGGCHQCRPALGPRGGPGVRPWAAVGGRAAGQAAP